MQLQCDASPPEPRIPAEVERYEVSKLKPSESFSSCMIASPVQGLGKQMSFSQQLKRGKQIHNGSNLSELTRSQYTIIITLDWTQLDNHKI